MVRPVVQRAARRVVRRESVAPGKALPKRNRAAHQPPPRSSPGRRPERDSVATPDTRTYAHYLAEAVPRRLLRLLNEPVNPLFG